MIHGIKKIIAAAVKSIFGTKVSVISWIDVAAWKIDIAIPTINETASIGVRITKVV
jgi:hypothetical protein